MNDVKTSDLIRKLNAYFESRVEIPRIKHGHRQTLETLINEEASLFGKYLRDERETWNPRIPSGRHTLEKQEGQEYMASRIIS